MFTTSSRVFLRPSSLPSLSLARSAFYKGNISPALASTTKTTTSPTPTPTTTTPSSILKPSNRPFSTSPSFQFNQSSVKMGVNMINTKDEFHSAIQSTESGKAIVIDCFATWCGPCVAIAPTLEKLSNENTNVGFYKVDVDESPDIAQELGVRAMPTFIFFKGGQKVETVTGANPPALQKAIETHGA